MEQTLGRQQAEHTTLAQVATALESATHGVSGDTLGADGLAASVVNGEIVITYDATATNQSYTAANYGLTTTSNGTDADATATIVQRARLTALQPYRAPWTQ